MTDGHKEQIEGERKRMGESVVAGKASEFTPAERREFMRLSGKVARSATSFLRAILMLRDGLHSCATVSG